jgi:uncharacterized repeat protein (TIGR02543 family)
MKNLRKILLKLAYACFTLLAVFAVGSKIVQKVEAYDASKLAVYKESTTEFRGVWVATVSNIDMDKQVGTSPEAIAEWKAKYLGILDQAQKDNLNAIIFQVRPCNDAFYPSKYNPWSTYLAGYGVNPGWDPVAWMIEVTHARGMEYHAWLNPYRASTSSTFSYLKKDQATGFNYIDDYKENDLNAQKLSYFSDLKAKGGTTSTGEAIDNPIFASSTTLYHNVVLGSEDKYILNPASEATTQHLINTLKELVDNYDLDGIHFDDYFYPDDTNYKGTNSEYKSISFSSEPYVDYADYQKAVSNGCTMSIYDWRRDNVNQLIENLSKLIQAESVKKNRTCEFGISPCGRWAPSLEACKSEPERGAEGGMDGSCNNYYAYSDLYADVKKWVDEDWIDYVVPQVYSNLDSGSYNEVVEWWSNEIEGKNCKLYIGTAAYLIDDWIKDKKATALELMYQIRHNQTNNYHVSGYVMFSEDNIETGKSAVAMDYVRRYLFKQNALTPVTSSTIKQPITNAPTLATLEKVAEGYSISFSDTDAKAIEIVEVEGDTETLVSRFYPNQGAFQIALTEGKNYSFYYYDNVNTRYLGGVIDLAKAKVNALPVISLVTKMPELVLANTMMTLQYSVTDEDSPELTYQYYLIYRGNERLISEGSVTSSPLELSWTTYAVDTPDLTFTLKVSDGKSVTTFVTPVFQLVEKMPKKTYSVTYVLDGGSANNPETYTEGATVKLNEAQKAGYQFMGWYKEASFTTKIESLDSSIQSDTTLYAKFEKINTYTITYVLDGGTAQNPTSYTNEETVELTSATKSGYTFDGWYLDSAFTNKITTISKNTITKDTTIYAKFTLIVIPSYTITYDTDGGSANNPTKVQEGESITLKDATKDGYTFDGWYTNKEKTDRIEVVSFDTISSDCTIYAKFTQNKKSGCAKKSSGLLLNLTLLCLAVAIIKKKETR